MIGRLPENNQVCLVGNIESDFQLVQSKFKNNYYKTTLAVERRSGTLDHIPVIVSDREFEPQAVSGTVCVKGEFRAYANYQLTKNRVMLFVYATELEAVNKNDQGSKGTNEIFLDGFIYKDPVYRITPLRRKITDILVAVSRMSKRIDYFPCICWGKSAQIAAMFYVGTHIRLWGRIQSREYEKRIGEEVELRTTYEVSVSKIEEVNDYLKC